MIIDVFGKPISQPRQRMRNAGKFIQSYTPAKHPVQAWKKAIKVAYLALNDRKSFGKGHPLRVTLNFIMPRPKSHFRSNGEVKDLAPRHHTSRPDVDNLAKAVLDALQDVGCYHDDAQISLLEVSKLYSQGPTDEPGVLIEIKGLRKEIDQS